MKKAIVCLALLVVSCATVPKRPMFDLKITNGRIIDGTGAPWFRGDVAVRGNTIVDIGALDRMTATITIDARDQVVSPGFIDLLGQSQSAVLEDPHLEAKVRQGVTTEVTGEGFSPGPAKPSDTNPEERIWHTLGEYLDALDRQGSAINFALLVGASNPREIVIGNVNRSPTADEMRQMEAIVEQAMREGAIGLSTSLIYLPAMYSTTEEIIDLARVAARYGGMYFTHMRDEGDKIDVGLDEAFRIGREANIPVNIWHLKVGGRANWGRMPHVIERIEQARAEGIDVAANVYPYIASSTALSTLAPDWALEGGYSTFKARLADPEQRARILETFRTATEKRGERGIFVSRIANPAFTQYEKHFMPEIASMMGTTQEEALARLFSETNVSPRVIFFSMDESDVQYALKQPWVSVGADSGSPTPADRAANSAVHPRGYGTFPRVAGHYVRDVKLFTLEEAVRKMTSQAADRAHLEDRGVLRPGMKADLIVFDPNAIRDVATFEDPHHFAEGMSSVIVNGVPVLRDGGMTSALPGRTIRGRGYVKR
ncbi:MAG TPA: D-aminoacylase [Thermoanaerobaculia bacterium]|jgi:dihydroorotase/N-acyl-D-amino-acid deacylase|nr:D-aminoacylase [Thermoanaerobaculia bacterium]